MIRCDYDYTTHQPHGHLHHRIRVDCRSLRNSSNTDVTHLEPEVEISFSLEDFSVRINIEDAGRWLFYVQKKLVESN